LDYPSVGATENVLMAAVAASGTTVIENAAREPEIQDLAEMLVEMGAEIGGAGTTTIEIRGVQDFTAVRHRVVPDRVEAGTFAIAACATQGSVRLEHVRADHLDLVLAKLGDAGANVGVEGDTITVGMGERARAVDFVTLSVPRVPHGPPAADDGHACLGSRHVPSPRRTCSRAGSCSSTS